MSKALPVEQTIPDETVEDNTFQTRKIMEIVGGHFVHDTYSAFVSPLLPRLIDKLSLSLTQAGSLTVFLQLPALLNILIGYMADKVSLHYFVIFAPATTATLISILGLTNSYLSLSILLFVAGISVALFHVPAPAMIGVISGKQVGRGMSLFMAGGEMGRTVGPLLVGWAVSMWGLDGIWRLAFIGWITTGFLYWRLGHISAVATRKKVGNIREALPRIKRLFIPLTVVMFLRAFVVTALSVYLVVMLEGDGYKEETAIQALSLWSFAGIGGALVGGTLSDRIGRKRMMSLGIGSSAVLMPLVLSAEGILLIPVLIVSGFTALAVTPVIQAMVQEYLVDNRAMANGLFMFFAFLTRSFATLLIGAMGDAIGLRSAFVVCMFIALLAVPAIMFLPESQTN